MNNFHRCNIPICVEAIPETTILSISSTSDAEMRIESFLRAQCRNDFKERDGAGQSGTHGREHGVNCEYTWSVDN